MLDCLMHGMFNYHIFLLFANFMIQLTIQYMKQDMKVLNTIDDMTTTLLDFAILLHI